MAEANPFDLFDDGQVEKAPVPAPTSGEPRANDPRTDASLPYYADLIANANRSRIVTQFGRDIEREAFASAPRIFDPANDLYSFTEADAVDKTVNRQPSTAEQLGIPRVAAGLGGTVQAIGEAYKFAGDVGPIEADSVTRSDIPSGRMGQTRYGEAGPISAAQTFFSTVGPPVAEAGKSLKDAQPPRAIESYKDIKSIQDGVTYILDGMAEAAGSTLPMFAGGMIAGVPGVVLTSWGAGIGEMKLAVDEEIAKLVQQANTARSMGLGMAADRLMTAAAKLDPKTHAQIIYAAGTTIGMLDSLVPASLFSSAAAAREVKALTAQYIVRRLVAGAVSGAMKEGVTEALQEGTQVAAIARMKGAQAATDYVQALNDNIDQIIDAGLMGAAGGVLFGKVEGASKLAGEGARLRDAAERGRGLMGQAQAQVAAGEPNVFDGLDEPAPPTPTPPPEAALEEPAPEASPVPAPDPGPIEFPDLEQRRQELSQRDTELANRLAEIETEMGSLQRDSYVAGQMSDAERQAQAAQQLDFEDIRSALPLDENGDPNVAALTSELERFGRKSWQDLSPSEAYEVASKLAPQTLARMMEESAVDTGRLAALTREVEQLRGERQALLKERGGLRQQADQAREKARVQQIEQKAATAIQTGGLTRSRLQALGVPQAEIDKAMAPKVKAGEVRKVEWSGEYWKNPGLPGESPRATDIRNEISRLAQEMAPILPKGTKIKSFAELKDIPQFANTLKDQDGKVVSRASGNVIDAFQQDDVIYLAAYAVKQRGRIAHEGLHVLVQAGVVKPEELSLLAERGRKTGAFPAEMEARYREDYAKRFPASEVQRRLDEEAAAHLIEARVNGKDLGKRINSIIDRIVEFLERLGNVLRQKGFQTANDVAEAFLTGEMANRVHPAELTGPVERYPSVDDAMFAMGSPDRLTGQSQRRDLDSLGYYSKALEAARSLKQAKGTPEQMLAQLRNAGTKDAEIEATDLRSFLDGKNSVTRDEIVSHLEGNRVGLRERAYDRSPPNERELANLRRDTGSENDVLARELGLGDDPSEILDRTKWSNYSLDPSNPTYREVVLHLPQDTSARSVEEFTKRYRQEVPDSRATDQQIAEIYRSGEPLPSEQKGAFWSGHFPEPNIIGHMMTSMTKHEGKPVYTIDQIQSDWGQKLRDGGVRDEGKIAEAERLYREANARMLAMEDERLPTLTRNEAEALTKQKFGDSATWATLSDEQRYEVAAISAENAQKNLELNRRMDEAGAEVDRLEAEWNTLRNSAVGNPLVNTTDQWVNTTLRRAVRLASEADAEFIAIPSGDTVLSYNPGDTDGMRGFYGGLPEAMDPWAARFASEVEVNPSRKVASFLDANDLREVQKVFRISDDKINDVTVQQLHDVAVKKAEGIVPKNLKNLLSKIDKDTPSPKKIDTLDSPSGKTNLGKGFTLFTLTDKVKQSVLDEGQPMFAFAGPRAKTADLEALAKAKKMEAEGWARNDILQQTGWFRDPGKNWRFEISDRYAVDLGDETNASFRIVRDFFRAKAPKLDRLEHNLGHAELFKAYPQLANLLVDRIPATGNNVANYMRRETGLRGILQSFMGKKGEPKIGLSARADRNAILHEVQHAIDDIEGAFAAVNRSDPYHETGYANAPFEMTARAVEHRSDLSDQQRASRPPWFDWGHGEARRVKAAAPAPDQGAAPAGNEPKETPKEQLGIGLRHNQGPELTIEDVEHMIDTAYGRAVDAFDGKQSSSAITQAISGGYQRWGDYKQLLKELDTLKATPEQRAASIDLFLKLQEQMAFENRTSSDPMYAFAGPRARTADLEALSRAKQMMEEGSSREDIWTETGWFRGVDGKWRWEIDDSGLSVYPGSGRGVNVGPVQHQKLGDAYDLGGIRTEASDGPAYGFFSAWTERQIKSGWMFPKTKTEVVNPGDIRVVGKTDDERRSVASHELQHAVQTAEGFAMGGDARSLIDEDGVKAAIEAARKEAGFQPDFDPFASDANPADVLKYWRISEDVGLKAYRRLAGEVEARAVQKRMNMTPEERRARPPWLDYDVPESEQIVRFSNPDSISQKSYSAEPPIEGYPTLKDGPMFAIRAYHGSPHDFDKFSLDHIGKGEGAQAYGFGLYFAESEGVARHYRTALSGDDRYRADGKRMDPFNVPADHAALRLAGNQGNRKEAIRLYDEEIATLREQNTGTRFLSSERSKLNKRIALLEQARASVADGTESEIAATGRLYEVSINASPEDFLDWDKPLSQQSEKVRKALIDAGYKLDQFGNKTGGDLVQYAFGAKGAERGALMDAGIPGIKYLDQMSRGQGEGTSNYVIFDDSLITITAKDGKPVEPQEVSDLKAAMSGGQEPMFAMGDGQVTPGLDMSPEARKQRAEQMGFDTSRVLYHGTNQPLEKFDASRLGSVTRSNSSKLGIFFTDSPELASAYADNAARNVVSNVSDYEAKGAALQKNADRLEKIAQRTNKPADWDRYEAAAAAWEAHETGAIQEGEVGQNIIPVYLRMSNPAEFDAQGKSAMSFDVAGAVQDAAANGHDGVIIRNLIDTPSMNDSTVATHYVVFDPKNIRSINAAFDPANSDSPNLMFAMGDADRRPEVKSLQSIVSDLARDLGLTIRQGLSRTAMGRAASRAGLGGVYDPATGVIRVRSVADANAVARAAGGAIQHRIGQPLEDVIAAHADELLLPAAPTAPAPTLAPNGFSGLALSRAMQARVRDAAMLLARSSALVATDQMQEAAKVQGEAQRALSGLRRRLGDATASAVIKDTLGGLKSISPTDAMSLLTVGDMADVFNSSTRVRARLEGMPQLPREAKAFILEGRTVEDMRSRARAVALEAMDPEQVRKALVAFGQTQRSAGDLARMLDALGMRERTDLMGDGSLATTQATEAYVRKLYSDIIVRQFEPSALPTMLDVSMFQPDAKAVEARIAERFTGPAPVPDEAPLTPSKAELDAAFQRWFGLYLVNPTAADAEAPFLREAMEQTIETADDVLLAKIHDSQNAIFAYYQANPRDVVLASVKDATKPGMWDRFADDRQRFGLSGALSIRLNQIYTNRFDKLNGFTSAVWELHDLIARNTGQKVDISKAQNPATLIRLAPHSHAWATRDMEQGVRNYLTNAHEGPGLIPALVTALGPDRGTARDMGPNSRYRQFGAYLVARYAPAEWGRYRDGTKERPPTPMPPGASTPDQAMAVYSAIRADLEREFPEFAQAAEQLYDYQQNLLKLQRDAGLIKPETFDELIQDREYVPFYRVFDEEEAKSSRALGSGAASVLKRKRGSERDVIDPIASIAQKTFETRSVIATNDVKRNLIALAEAAGPGGGVIAERVNPKQLQAIGINVEQLLQSAAREVDADPRDATELMDVALVTLGNDAVANYYTQRTITPGREPITFFWDKGELQAIRLGDGEHGHKLAAQMFDALNTFGRAHLDHVMKLAQLPAQITRLGVTTHPEFAAANLVRDALMAFMYDPRAMPFLTQLQGMIDVGRNAEYVQKFYATAGMMGGEATGALDKLRTERDTRALMERGYRFRLFDSLPNMLDRLKEITEARNWMDRVSGGLVGGIAGAAAGGPVGAIGGGLAGALVGGKALVKLGEVSETATRARLWKHAYDRSIQNGMDEVTAAQEAAFWAHDYTDYSRRGSKMDGWAAIIPFLNANIQGNDTYIRRLLGKGDQGYNPGILFPLYRLGMLDVTKLTPKQQQELGLSAWTWGMTIFGLGSISAVIALMGDDDERLKDINDQTKASHWIFAIGDTVYRIPKPFQTVWFSQLVERWINEGRHSNPRWFEHYVEDLWNTWKPPMVPSIAEGIATGMGMDLNTGRQIIPDTIKRQDLQAPNQFDAYTSEFGKWAGKALDVSPLYVDHAIIKFGASWGRTFTGLNMPGLPWYNPQKPIKGVEEEFIARRFLWKVGRGSEAGQAIREIMGGEQPLKMLWDRFAQPASKLAVAGRTYRDLIEAPTPKHAEAVEYLKSLTPYERGYAVLEGHYRGGDAGQYRMLHPMNRAETIGSVTLKMEKEIVGGELLSGRKGTKAGQKELPMTPSEKTAARDILTQYRMMETHNALVLTGEKGWAGRMMFDTKPVLAELKTAAPNAYKELMARFDKQHVLPWAGIQETWPKVKERSEDPRWVDWVRTNRVAQTRFMFADLYERAKAGRLGGFSRPQSSQPAAVPMPAN